jgi:hypothetical protein
MSRGKKCLQRVFFSSSSFFSLKHENAKTNTKMFWNMIRKEEEKKIMIEKPSMMMMMCSFE